MSDEDNIGVETSKCEQAQAKRIQIKHGVKPTLAALCAQLAAPNVERSGK